MNYQDIIKALVVDDEKVIRDFLVRLLSLEAIETKAVDDGFKAIEMAKQEKFDIIFLDVRMPQLNGVDTLRELRKISPDSKYILMTGYAVDDLLEKAEKEGIVASIRKPFEISQILTFIKDYKQEKQAKEKINILVVDDDKNVLGFFKRLLSEEAYDVTTVDTGKEALEEINKQDFDLMFLDVVLKDINGLKLCLKVRDLKPNLDIVFITGYLDKSKEEVKELNIQGFLYKPFEIDKIFAEIDKVRKLKGL